MIVRCSPRFRKLVRLSIKGKQTYWAHHKFTTRGDSKILVHPELFKPDEAEGYHLSAKPRLLKP